MFAFFNRSTQNTSELTWHDTRDGLSAAYEKAFNEYSSEKRFLQSKSKIGVEFKWTDFVTFSLSKSKTEQVSDLKKIIEQCKSDIDDKKVLVVCIDYLLKYGSSWGGPEHSLNNFSNYFLTCLRHENVHAFRTIIGKAFGVKFIEDACTLYRRDTRSYKEIFIKGFELKNEFNSPGIRKKKYYNPVTLSVGISTALTIPPAHYGRPNSNAYFVIEFKMGHQALLIDIDQSPCNQGRHQNLKEVNSVDAIPRENIEKFVIKKSYSKRCERISYFFCKKTKEIENPNFNSEKATSWNLNKIASIK